jgi:hypothetical protein
MRRLRPRRLALWLGALALLLVVFALYMRPDMAVTLANQIWSCF